MKKMIFATIFMILSLSLSGEVRFSELDLTSKDILSFNMTVDYPGYGTYNALLMGDLNLKGVQQLTYFPEKIMYLEDTGEFQIQNRFGVFRTVNGTGQFKAIDLFSSFVNTYKIERGKILPIQSSPDGKYLVYIQPQNETYGKLTLYNPATDSKVIISEDIEISLAKDVAIWSEDSQFIVYTKEENLFYFSIEHLKENRVFAEPLRKIGKGVLSNVRWGSKNQLYYVSDFLIYRIGSREFFTRAFYKDILRIGVILGKIPFSFNSNFDTFWISPDGTKILLNKGGRNLFLYYLSSEDFVSTGTIQSLPYLYLPRNQSVSRVLWSQGDLVTVLTRGIENGSQKSSVFRLTLPEEGQIAGFQQTTDEKVKEIILSPGGGTAAVLKENSVEFRTYSNWTLLHTLTHPQPISAIWKSDKEIYVAGARYTELYGIESKASKLVAFSQADRKGISKDEKFLIVQGGEKIYRLDIVSGKWEKHDSFDVKENAISSDAFRIYLTDSTTGGYSNMIMIRHIGADTFGTYALFNGKSLDGYEPFPTKEEAVDFSHFAHGSRIRRREIALVFNVVDSIEGLPAILNTLADYNLKCTFFINGEAIKRYSGAVKEIARSGHEVGSLFYAHFNMVDSRYDLDKKFIKLGLAINEDEYFNVTGKELALLWHAPYYFINSDITEASREMGYTYVGRDIDAMDWVTKDMSGYTAGIYLPAGKLVNKILKEKKPGSIVPIMTGLPKGERDDFLFEKLDLLINALLNRGYAVVPVSTLIEHSR